MEYSLSESLEDYLLGIFEVGNDGRVIRIKDIAKRCKVKLSSAVAAVKALVERKLLEHEKYGYITLTDYGIEIASKLYERKKTILKFLIDILGVSEETALKDAHKMEHDLSEETLELLIRFTNFSGESSEMKENIERFKLSKRKRGGEHMETTLKDLKVGESGKILKISKVESGLKSKLLDMGATPGTVIKVEKVAPLGDPMDVLILGYHLSLRREEAEKIIVERI